MRSEVESDIAAGRLYESPRLSDRGQADYPSLLLSAIDTGDDTSLAADLTREGHLNTHEMKRNSTKPAKVPITASHTLAEGEFNRYYARAVCLRAINEGYGEVRVYRAKQVTSPRAKSELILGKLFSAQDLLDDLRSSIGVEPALGLPQGPNSGLSVELPI